MSKMKSWNDEPAIQQKEYSQEEYNKKKRISLKVAKLSCYSAELMVIIGWNLMLSLILFLVLCLGTSALPYIMDINIDFTPETFWCRGGIFVNLCEVFLVLFSIAGFTYAISYKVTEVMCIHLDGGLDGVMEVNDAAMRANLKGQVAKVAGLAYADAEVLAGPMREIIKELNVKLIGHYRYYGVTWNFRKITTFLHRVQQFLYQSHESERL